jgi:predicted nucleic acid-binding protein
MNDVVQFRLATDVETSTLRAVKIEKIGREAAIVAEATIEALKESFGFLNFQVEEESTLFFHFHNRLDDVELGLGDTLSFEVARNPKSGKLQAINVRFVRCVWGGGGKGR